MFQATTLRAKGVREKSRWIVRQSPPSVPPIPLNHCRRVSMVRSSRSASCFCTICRSKTLISEARPPAGSRQSPSRLDCAHCVAGPRLAYSVSMNPGISELPLVAVVGPTASGKSALGVWLAEQFGGEVLACDSTQLYRGFDIGTPKLSQAQRHGIPHHLIDALTPNEDATAGGYRQLALVVMEDLRSRGRLPILTVGTGLYLRALLEGLAEAPLRSEELRERLRASAAEHATGYLHRLLKRMDPETAGKIA